MDDEGTLIDIVERGDVRIQVCHLVSSRSFTVEEVLKRGLDGSDPIYVNVVQ